MFILFMMGIGVILTMGGIVYYISIEEDINNKKMNAITIIFNGLSILILSLSILFLIFSDLNKLIKDEKIKIPNEYKSLKVFINV